MNYTTEVIEARPDWVRGTTTDDAQRGLSLALGRDMIAREGLRGEPAKAFRFLGYAGLRTDHVAFGERPDSVLLQASSDRALEWFQEISEATAHNTRIDICVTVRCNPPQKHLALIARRQAIRQRSTGGRPFAWTYMVDHRGAETLYLGRRSSRWFLRVYNKELETRSDAYRACWRYEVEAKGLAAIALDATIRRAPNSQACILGLVQTQFQKHGVLPPTGGIPIDAPLPEPIRLPADLRAQRWLETQVGPSVQARLATHGRAKLFSTLGLPPSLARAAPAAQPHWTLPDAD